MCTVSSLSCSRNSFCFFQMPFLLVFWFSDVVTGVSHPGVRTAEPFVWVSAFFPHPSRHNEPIRMCWKEVRQSRGPGRAGDSATPVLSAESEVPVGTVTSSKREDKPAVATVSADCAPNAWGLDRDSSSGDTGVYHNSSSSHQRSPTPRISNSSPPSPHPNSRIPTTSPVSLPPGSQSPSVSDADSSFAGFRRVDCLMRLRVDDAFSSYREDDSDWDDAWRVR